MDEEKEGIAARLDSEVPDEAKLALLRQKLQLWFNTVYDARVDVELAELTDNDALLTQAQARLKEAVKTVHALEKKIGELDNEG